MSQNKKKGVVVIAIGLVGLSYMAYSAFSYKFATSEPKKLTPQALQVVESIDGEATTTNTASNVNTQSQSSGAPSINGETALPNNIPPAMLAAMKERGISVEDLRNAGSSQQGTPEMGDSAFPEAMQKALAERQVQMGADGNNSQGSMNSTANTPAALLVKNGIVVSPEIVYPSSVIRAINHLGGHPNPLSKEEFQALVTGVENKTDVESRIKIAENFIIHNELNGALYFLQEASIIEPANPTVPYITGQVFIKGLDVKKGAEQWERSLALQDNPNTRYELALMYRYQLNQKDKAMEHLNIALKSDNLPTSLKEKIEKELK